MKEILKARKKYAKALEACSVAYEELCAVDRWESHVNRQNILAEELNQHMAEYGEISLAWDQTVNSDPQIQKN